VSHFEELVAIFRQKLWTVHGRVQDRAVASVTGMVGCKMPAMNEVDLLGEARRDD
jgi:hypothetical protein